MPRRLLHRRAGRLRQNSSKTSNAAWLASLSVDVLSGKVDGPNAPIPLARIQHDLASHLSRDRSTRWPSAASSIADQAGSVQRCGSLQRGEPCDWERTTLVVETANLKANTRGSSPGLRLVERFTRTGRDSIKDQVTFIDPATWTAPWTAALDLKSRPDAPECSSTRVTRGTTVCSTCSRRRDSTTANAARRRARPWPRRTRADA